MPRTIHEPSMTFHAPSMTFDGAFHLWQVLYECLALEKAEVLPTYLRLYHLTGSLTQLTHSLPAQSVRMLAAYCSYLYLEKHDLLLAVGEKSTHGKDMTLSVAQFDGLHASTPEEVAASSAAGPAAALPAFFGLGAGCCHL